AIGSRLNRITLSFNLADALAGKIDAFVQNLRENSAFRWALEDSGEWVQRYRIPLCKGMSFVEREGSISWDYERAPWEIIPAKKLLSDPWYEPPPRQCSQLRYQLGISAEKASAIRSSGSLRPIGRSTKMPGLKFLEKR
ncbi:MAG: hypothetical protein Q7K45_01645, partial [Nanoarchaeota archaeon]|nr:hypothetical protein [Nanoarchaeota archaeon]